MQTVFVEQIKSDYPNEWILIGNPDLGNEKSLGSIIDRLIGGVILYHSKDKNELAQNAKEVRKGFKSVTLLFTGEIPKNRKFWL